MKLKRIVILLVLFILLVQNTIAQSSQKQVKVIGYVTDWSLKSKITKIEFCKISMLNISFANPDVNAKFKMGSNINLKNSIRYIKNKNPNVKVYIAIAGAYASQEPLKTRWLNFMKTEQSRKKIVDSLLAFVDKYSFDGVDVDLEWGVVPSDYNPFVTLLSEKLKQKNLGITVALPNHTSFAATTETLKKVDYVNIMSYDKTGSWALNNPGQHSPYTYAEDGIDYWNITKGIPTENLTLGVPFYGHRFGSNPGSFMYSNMINQDTTYADLDQVGDSYYNGRPTIENKVELTIQKQLGGIMIWQLGQDAFNKFSLLKAIDNKIQKLGYTTENSCPTVLSVENQEAIKKSLNVFKNYDSQIIVKTPYAGNTEISLFTTDGRELSVTKRVNLDHIVLEDINYKGMILVRINIENMVIFEKVYH